MSRSRKSGHAIYLEFRQVILKITRRVSPAVMAAYGLETFEDASSFGEDMNFNVMSPIILRDPQRTVPQLGLLAGGPNPVKSAVKSETRAFWHTIQNAPLVIPTMSVQGSPLCYFMVHTMQGYLEELGFLFEERRQTRGRTRRNHV